MSALRVGIVGSGTLARRVMLHLTAANAGVRLSGILLRAGREPDRNIASADNLRDFLALGHDVVVECASQAALREHALSIVESGVGLVPASIGALVDADLVAALRACGARGGGRVRLPSGAIVGLDGLAAARHGGIESVLYRGTMAPGALVGFDAPPDRRVLAFSGVAREAVARFPKNANLTGTVALAGIGFDRTRVELWTDPSTTANVHELQVRGAFGEFDLSVRGLRISATSPSSRLVAGSLAEAALGSGYILLAPEPPPAAHPTPTDGDKP